ncbi:MAG: hypothetical protein A3J28_18200 [Acidobacteria bacterium RIFCSPLOWO2_12_FULL_60_22]|nr:MAG: hypothetical protein A3J28_18200 [Acidobacteria bacterium RIFCSPLOWO2_12_FULL_60_22]
MTKTRILVLFCLPLFVLALDAPELFGQRATPSAVGPQEMRGIADGLYGRGRYEEARDVYLKIQPQFAADAELNRNLGWCFYRVRRPDLLQAIHYWSLSWQVEENESLKNEAARAYFRLGRYEDGTKLLLELAERHPERPEHWRDAASLAESAQRYPQAISWYQSYLDRRAGDIPARLAMARLLGWDKKYSAAVTEYNIVLQTDPKNVTARIGVAQVLAWQGALEESLRRYDAILEEQPRNLEARTGKAFVLLWMGQFPEAKPLFEALSRRRPADIELRSALVEIARLEAAAAAAAAPAPAAAVAPAPPNPLDALRARIDDAFRESNGAAAVSLLQQALELAPGNLELQRRLAQAHLLADQTDAAIRLLQELRSNSPDNADVLRELATAQVRAGKLSEGADTLTAYLEKKPGDRPARVEMARLLSWSRRFDEATRAFQEVLREDPENVESQVGLGQVSLWQGRSEPALGQFDAVLSKHPDHREALIGKGQSLYWSGKKEEAYQLFAQIQEKFPQDREIAALLEGFRDAERQQVAQQAAVPPDVDTLIRSYQEVLSRNPREFEALRMLGELYARKSNFNEAVAFYRRARAEHPQDLQLQQTLARTLSWIKEFKESADLYRDLLSRDPNPATRLELARVLSWGGQYSESVETYKQLLALQPDQAEARLGLARVLSWSRDYEESLQTYREMIEQDPKNRDAQVEYARVHAWKGDLNRAVKLYADLQALYPDDRDVLLGKGQALQWSGRPQEAQEVLSPLRAAYPNDREVLLAMAGTQLALGRSDLAMRELQVAEANAPDDRDVQLLRSLVLRQLRPVLTLNFSPSLDSDDLHIFPYTGTLYFSPIARIRSYFRGAVIPSMIPSAGISQGREALFGSTAQVAPWVILRGEIGGNSGSTGEHSSIGGGGFTLLPWHKLRFDFDASRQFINYLPLSVDKNISRVQIRTGWDFRPTNRFLLHMDYFHGRYSDTNRSNGANLIASQTLVRRERLTLDGGYTYSASGFSTRTNSGYFAPSQLQRHAGMASLYGRINSWLGYNVGGTLGAEQISRDPFRLDGTLRASTDFSFSERLKLSVGYGYFRIASLVRAGAYKTHSAFANLEIRF